MTPRRRDGRWGTRARTRCASTSPPARPASELASTGYCLADPGREYLVYLPDGGAVTVDLSGAKGKLSSEWTHPITGKITAGEAVEGGKRRTFKAPFDGDAVLYLRKMP